MKSGPLMKILLFSLAPLCIVDLDSIISSSHLLLLGRGESCGSCSQLKSFGHFLIVYHTSFPRGKGKQKMNSWRSNLRTHLAPISRTRRFALENSDPRRVTREKQLFNGAAKGQRIKVETMAGSVTCQHCDTVKHSHDTMTSCRRQIRQLCHIRVDIFYPLEKKKKVSTWNKRKEGR